MRNIVCMLILLHIFLLPVFVFAQNTPQPQQPTTAQDYFIQAHKAFKKGDFETVEIYCTAAVSMQPNFAEAHYMLGKAYLLHAAKINNLAVKDWGMSSPETQYIRQIIKGRPLLKKSIKAFNEVLRYDPENQDAILNRGDAKNFLGQKQEAAKDYQKAIELDKVSTQARDAYNNLGLIHMGEKNFKEAKKDFESALKIDPHFIPAKLNLDKLYTIKPKLKNKK